MLTYPEFPLENHEVQTEDGYILSLQRISYLPTRSHQDNGNNPLGKVPTLDSQASSTGQNIPVLFVHGLVATADIWCLDSADKCLPYELAAQGRDCWLVNLRGTPLSNRHASLLGSNPKFWDFSFHEMGLFDIPSVIHYILDVTGGRSIDCICHSMGCTVLLLCLSLLPNMNSKISHFVAIAPAVYGKHLPSKSAKIGVPFANIMGRNAKTYQMPLVQHSSKELGEKFRIPYVSAESMGLWFLRRFGSFGGFGNFKYIEEERMPDIAAVFPAPSSTKVIVHGSQWMKEDKTLHFNYGTVENLKRYGQDSPPEYNFQLVTAPVTIFYTDGDQLCHPQDIKRLADELPNLVNLVEVACPGFSHMEFLMGKNCNTLVHSKIIDLLNTK